MFLFLAKNRGEFEYVYSLADFYAVFLLILVTVIFFIIGATKYQKSNPILYKHFMACYFLKIIGCLGFVSIYTFYYGYGDTFRYYQNARAMLDMASYSPITYVETMMQDEIIDVTKKFPEYADATREGSVYNMFRAKNNFLVVRFAAFFGLFTFGSYLSISIMFAVMSTLGVWALYRSFTHMFPGHENALAIPVIYFPSMFFWGSSIMKDSIVICYLGFLTYAVYMVFVKKKNIFLGLILLLFSFAVLRTTKEYVIIAYIPAVLIWVILSISNSLPKWFQLLFRPVLAVLAVGSIFLLGPKIGEVSEKYAMEQVLKTAEVTGTYIYKVSAAKDGSGYTLGNVSYTPAGMVSLFPKAVAVTLYRPFLFEAKNPVMLLSALESSLVLFFTLFVLFRVGVFRFIRALSEHPFLLAALVFSVFFAFAIGVSTMNFGALARYKIPCLPFYGLAIMYPYSEYRKNKKAQQKTVKQAFATED